MKPGTKPRTCGTCGGSGIVTQVARTPLGMLQQQSACPQCQGTGQIVDEYCGSCSGRGRLQKSKQLMITIPPGVDSGSRLRIRKEGDAGPKGGPPGDLYVFLKVKPSKDFKRDGADIYTEVRPQMHRCALPSRPLLFLTLFPPPLHSLCPVPFHHHRLNSFMTV
jgi:molecular chaperone DnaJ